MFTATTRSTNTVSANVTSRMTTSAGGARRTIFDEMPRLAHVPGDDEQDRGERGERNVHGQRRQQRAR